MVATSGDLLLTPDAAGAVKTVLIPLAALITPNLHEAAELLGARPATTIEEMEMQARCLLDLGPGAVLMKGGHATGDFAIDVLATREGTKHFSAARINTRNTHGTGCTLSAAITAHLARGRALDEAVGLAKQFLTQALISGASKIVGDGFGPVDHLVNIERARGG